MGCQLKFNKGITLMELLVVIAIFSVLTSGTVIAYTNFTAHSNLEVAVFSLTEALRFAQKNAEAVSGDSKWGVLATTSQIIIFKGNNYTNRDTAFDQGLDFPRETTASGLSEIVFEKMTGDTLTTGTIVITNSYGTKNININAKGTITY